ncbi:MAG: FAD-dependent oxidoreductase [Clostridia bacterium]|nr:FAD-dependent oxidoreductase [Clostridia bacterium]
MKKKMAMLLCMALLCISALAAADMTPGTYTGTAKGMMEGLTVSVTVNAAQIEDIVVTAHGETPGISDPAIEQIPAAILEAQSLEVDNISGATMTSEGIKKAVEAAIAQAGGEGMFKAAAVAKNTAYTAGTYTTNVQGMAGRFDVTVVVSEERIESVEIGSNKETTMVGTEAVRILPARIVESQSLGVDTLSGATVTSNAILYGVRECIKQAGGDVDALEAVPVELETYADKKHESDILVVGGGMAGISAAIAAQQNGGDVILIDEKEYLGGNSVLSTGTFIFGGTSVQAALGIADDPDTFYSWAIENSGGRKDPVQVAMVAYHGQEYIDFLAEMDVYFNDKKVNSTDGSEINRGHAIAPNIGAAVSKIVAKMEEMGIDIRYATHAYDLIVDENGKVIGVKAIDAEGNEVEYKANHVVLACGGWGDNNEMIVENWGKEYDGLVYGGAKGMDGTMLNVAVGLGAALVDMDDPHIDATLEVTRGLTITTNVLRNCGGILVRQSTGERFADEVSNHSEIAAAIMHDLGDPYYYEIFDDDALTYSDAVTTKIQAYFDMGLTQDYMSVEEMANGLGIEYEALKKTIDDYNAAVRGDISDPYGRVKFLKELDAPYHVMKVANGVACTTGGLKVDEKMHVIREDGSVIDGLYAIGEISGGYRVHYVGGDSMSHSGISGMLIGKQLTGAAD